MQMENPAPGASSPAKHSPVEHSPVEHSPVEHSKARRNIVIAAGETGGHIFPALAVTESLPALSPGVKIHLIHSGKFQTKRILPEALFQDGAPWTVHALPSGALSRGSPALVRLRTLINLPFVTARAFLLLKRLRPQAVLACGGAVSGPVLTAAFLLRIRRAVWEGNSSLGLANRLLVPFTQKIITFFPDVPLPSQAERKRTVCGYPLRKNFVSFLKQRRDGPHRGGVKERLHKKKFSVLILGGSQGSSLLNRAGADAVSDKDSAWRRDVFIFHQTGQKDFASLKQKYSRTQGAEAFAFSSRIEEYYEKSDLIFSRAGAGVTAEIAALGRPLVLVPLAKAAGGHQLKNALALKRAGAALYIPEKEWSAALFKQEICRLKQDGALRRRLAQNIQKLHKAGGALDIARLLLPPPPAPPNGRRRQAAKCL